MGKIWQLTVLFIYFFLVNSLVSCASGSSATDKSVINISLSPVNSVIQQNKTQQYTLTATYSDGTSRELTTGIVWNSSNPSVVTIDNNGLATVVAASGTSNITATYAGVTSSMSSTLTATAAKVTAVTINPINSVISKGFTQEYTATATYSDGTSSELTTGLVWNSSNPSVVTIDNDGLATVVAASGFSNITATYAGVTSSMPSILTATAAKVVAVSITPLDSLVAKGWTQEYTAIVRYSDGSSSEVTAGVTWTSSNPSVATIDNDGLANVLTTSGNTNITAAYAGVSSIIAAKLIAKEAVYAYILNYGNNSYTQCIVNPADGTLSNCNTVIPTGRGALDGPSVMTIDGIYAYIPNVNNNSYTQCVISTSDGTLLNCNTVIPTGNGALDGPSVVLINNGYAYITNYLNNSFVQCIASSIDGTLSNCNTFVPSGSGALSKPNEIAINNGYAYITNYDANSYTQCNVSPVSGLLSNCNTTTPSGGATLNGPTGITINNGYAYIANYHGASYTQCNVNSTTGTLSNCNTVIPDGSGALLAPTEITINRGYAYITNDDNNSYTQCNVSPTNGALLNCNTIIPSGSGALNRPSGVTF